MTKRETYETLSAILDAYADELSFEDPEVTTATLKDFLANEIKLLDNKSEKAKARAEAKKVEGDALRARVYEVLSPDEFMTVPQVVAALNDEDISAQMATARLTQLVSNGQAIKESHTVPSSVEGGRSRRLSTYKRA